MRRYTISGVSVFPVPGQGMEKGRDALRERKRDCKPSTLVKTYSPGHLGLQLNADTPVIPMYSLHLSMSDNCSVFSSGTLEFITV